jgi:hypothetical protein
MAKKSLETIWSRPQSLLRAILSAEQKLQSSKKTGGHFLTVTPWPTTPAQLVLKTNFANYLPIAL